MGRVCVIERDAIGWRARWKGQHDVAGCWASCGECAEAFAGYYGIPVHEFMNESAGKWRGVQCGLTRWEIHEVDSAAPVAASRQPRRGRIEYFSGIFVGWWADRPTVTADGQTVAACLIGMAALIRLDGEQLLQDVAADRGWLFTASNAMLKWDLVEVLPETSGKPRCQDCKGSGKYVGFLEIEKCRGCGGVGVLA